MEKDFKCKICQTETKDQKQLMFHIKKFHSEIESYEKYVVKFYFDGIYPLCKCDCGTQMKFFSYEPNFFNDYVKNHFPRKPHSEETKELIKVNSKKGMIDKHGVDNAMKLQIFVDKIGDTKEKNHGNRNYNNPKKISEIKLNRTPEEVALTNERLIETNMDRFGAKTFTSTEEGKAQVRKTKFDNHGDEFYCNHEKMRKTKLDKTGFECEFSNPAWRDIHNNGKTSKIEITVGKKLEAEPKFRFVGKEYDMKLGNYIIEVDGDYIHPAKLENMNLKYQLNNSINDYIKTKDTDASDFELVRIQVSTLHSNKGELDFEFVLNNRYYQDFSLQLNQILVSAEEIEYFTKFDEGNSLKRRIQTMFRFLKVFEPEYIHLLPEEVLSDWRNKSKIKEAISICFGLNGNEPSNVSLENLINILVNSKL